jgi:hypothetical protein
MSSLPGTSLPPIDTSLLPAEIRGGDAKAKKAYQEALGFEDILVQQLAQQLAQTVTSPGDSSDDGSDDSSGSTSSAGGMLGSDPSTAAFAGLIPTALTQSIMSGGGIGVAAQLARAIDPAIGTPSTTKGKP